VGHKKDGKEFLCQIVNNNMAIELFKVIETNKKYTTRVV
jgi:hypothetical protein